MPNMDNVGLGTRDLFRFFLCCVYHSNGHRNGISNKQQVRNQLIFVANITIVQLADECVIMVFLIAMETKFTIASM